MPNSIELVLATSTALWLAMMTTISIMYVEDKALRLEVMRYVTFACGVGAGISSAIVVLAELLG